MNLPPNVLYITYDGLSDPLGQAQILPYILGLEKKGIHFTVISFEKKAVLSHNKDSIISQLNNTNITWIPCIYHKKPPVISTLFDLWKMKRRAKKCLKSHSFSLIHCRSYLPMLVALKVRKHQKVIFDMRGLWADERVEGGIWPQKKPLFLWIYKFFIKHEEIFIKQADAIVSLTHQGICALSERYPNLNLNKFSVIPCCTDTHLFNPTSKGENIKKELGIQADQKVLLHVGSVGTWYRLDQEIAFFNILNSPMTPWVFIVLTNDKAKAQRIVDEFATLPEYIRVIQAKYHEVPQYLEMATACIQFIEPTFSKLASCPVKFGEALSMGIPVIANSGIGDIASQIENHNLGLCLSDWANVEKTALSFNPESYNPNQIRQFAIEKYNLSNGVESYSRVYQSLWSHD